MEEGVPIEHGMVSGAIERAQKQVEAQNFGVRKHLLEYDDVMNKQRESVYTLRREILDGQVHVAEDEVTDLPLHPGFAASWERLRSLAASIPLSLNPES